jgi:hypothetical protein
MFSFSPSSTDFAMQVTLSGKRGAERNPPAVVRIVVVVRAAGIDVVEVIAIVVVGGAEPPDRGASIIDRT